MLLSVKPREVEVSPDHSHLWLHYSHQAYDDFSRTDYYDHWKIAKVFEAARQCAMDSEVLGLAKVVSQDIACFGLGVHYHTSPELWTLHLSSVFPYKVSIQISELGRTSVSVYQEMVNKLDNRTLATAKCKFVLVDRRTRRPTPLPDWYQQKYATIASRQHRPLSLPRTVPQVPDRAYCYSLVVVPSDTDINGHTNQASYVRFCCDAAQSAVMAHALTGFTHDIASYPMIEQLVVFIRESDMGDRLQVHVWQPQDQESKLMFVVTRRRPGSKPSVIYQAYMLFQMRKMVMPTYSRM